MKDRSDELSTADLAGQSAGSGVADEHAVRGEPADQTGERRDAFPAEGSVDADYADDRGDHADDRVGGMGSRGFSGGTPADRAAYADEDPTLAADRAGHADRADDVAGAGYADGGTAAGDHAGFGGGTMAADRAGYPEDAAAGADRAGYLDDAAVTGDRAGHAGGAEGGDRAGYGDGRPGGEVAGGPEADDPGFGGGRGIDPAAERGYGTGGVRESAAAGNGAATGAGTGEAGPLLAGTESEGFRARWTDVQTGFVDAPRRSVEQADALVAELMQHLAKSFADERSRLEGQWDRGEDIPTDDLRTAFQRYRSFFERLLST